MPQNFSRRETGSHQPDAGALDIPLAARNLSGKANKGTKFQAQLVVQQLGRVDKGIAVQPAQPRKFGIFKTGDHAEKIKDAMDITDEDIKYLRDIAEQEAINKYTTAEVKIEMGGIHNNVSGDTDVDGMMRYINDSLIGGMQAGAEKVHP